MSLKQDMELMTLIATTLSFDLAKLLYRASELEYSAAQFHKLCDDQGPTITIIKSNFGNIFGGYTIFHGNLEDIGKRIKMNPFHF